jgi:hypothetical protein
MKPMKPTPEQAERGAPAPEGSASVVRPAKRRRLGVATSGSPPSPPTAGQLRQTLVQSTAVAQSVAELVEQIVAQSAPKFRSGRRPRQPPPRRGRRRAPPPAAAPVGWCRR